GEIARHDLAERIALPEVVALVIEHGAKLVRVEPFHECRRKADARTDEPVAERERPLVGDDVDPAVEIEATRGEVHRGRQRDLLRDETADENSGRDELAEERRESE